MRTRLERLLAEWYVHCDRCFQCEAFDLGETPALTPCGIGRAILANMARVLGAALQ